MLEKKIIPAILTEAMETFTAQFKQVEQCPIVQLDYVDGMFAPIKTCCDASLLSQFSVPEQLEVHMMVNDPIIYVDEWVENGVKRLIGHIEDMPDQDDFVNQIATEGVGVGLALKIDTPLDRLNPNLVQHLDLVLLMAHEIGVQGSMFNPAVIEKVRQLRAQFPHLNIEVDGGMNEETIPQVLQAGANYFAVGSDLFQEADPMAEVRRLEALLS